MDFYDHKLKAEKFVAGAGSHRDLSHDPQFQRYQ